MLTTQNYIVNCTIDVYAGYHIYRPSLDTAFISKLIGMAQGNQKQKRTGRDYWVFALGLGAKGFQPWSRVHVLDNLGLQEYWMLS